MCYPILIAMFPIEFTPKIFTVFKEGITFKQFSKDLIAGVIVGIVALPLAIAFAIASGVSPEKGLITAIIAGFLISLLGGSRVQIGGPTGAFIVIVYAIVQEHGVGGLTIATFMAGFIIIGMGLLRLGNLLKFIPYPLVVGFTSGIALIIFSSQINDFLGLSIEKVPANFIDKWQVYAQNIEHFNWIAAILAVSTILISFNFKYVSTKIPGSIVAIVLCTFAVFWFDLPVATIETRFGELPNSLSLPKIPNVSWATIQSLIQPAFAIAILGSIESLLSAMVADGMTGGKHRSNAELTAQGIANIFSGLFGGIPATGAIARTATNVKNGGRTPIAGITHALVLLLILLYLAPFAKLIPLSCLAGILVVVAYHMSEWRQFKDLLKGNKMDVLVLLTTFFLTVIFDLIIAIEIGMVLSSFLFMKRMSDAISIEKTSPDGLAKTDDAEQLFDDELPKLPAGVVLYEINGTLFFGATKKFQETLNDLNTLPKVLILRMRNVPFVDATGIRSLKDIIHRFQCEKVHVVLSGVGDNIRKELIEGGINDVLIAENILDNIGNSIERAKSLLVTKP
ncbi:MAG: SulP family inorganic anion transporter [Flavobacteriaceae bacterium]|nr:SulP family inorganic anion transporter [Flavobacteriaceae bacterium]